MGCPAIAPDRCGGGFFQKAADFDRMTDLPQSLRNRLADEFSIWSTTMVAVQKEIRRKRGKTAPRAVRRPADRVRLAPR